MARKDSVQKRLEKVRPPRVQLTYDVQIGDAIEKKELPFVVGVLGEFSGEPDPAKALSKVKDRKFVNVDMDNFDDVLAGMAPRATFRVRNRIGEEGGEFGVDLEFRSMDDFRPESVVQQVEPLRRMLEARTKLADLRNQMSGNERLGDRLTEALNNTREREQLGSEVADKE